MPSIKEFVEALQAGWFPALVALIGCSVVVAGNWYAVPYLSSAPGWLITTAVIVGVFAFSILAANVVYLPILAFKLLQRRSAGKAWKRKIRDLVEDSPYDERAILAYLVTTGRKAFAAKLDDRRLVPLVAKGLINRLGGQNSFLEWPFVVQEDVWTYLQEHKERFNFEKASEMPDAFHWLNRN